MLKIGDFSKLSRISIRMLRHYAELGLLVPKTTDNFTSYRYYGEDQLPIAARINSLKDMGFGLSAIGEILKHYDDPKALAEFLSVRYRELQTEAALVGNRLQLLESSINQLRKDETVMNYNITLKTLPERTVASVRKIIPNYWNEGTLWDILCKEIDPLPAQRDNPCYAIAVFHDEGFKEADVDVEVQLSVKGNYKNTENVVFKTEPAVEIASATYKGSYEQMPKVNEAVANWVVENGYEFSGPAFDIYHVSPHETQNPEELVTEVCYPVKKK